VRVVAALLLVAIASGFALLGGLCAIGGESIGVQAFGVLVLAYAVVTAIVVVKAWRTRGPYLPRLMAILGVALAVVWFVGSFDYGMLSDREIVGVFGVVLVAALNWWCVRIPARPA
jgi:uncharacterized membrane protein YfcA